VGITMADAEAGKRRLPAEAEITPFGVAREWQKNPSCTAPL
jgi:hypothetical protein